MRLNYSRTGASGLVYDGENLSDVFQIVDVGIQLLPTIEAVTHDLAQRPGSYFASRKVGTREITVKLRLDAETRNPMGIFHAWREVSSVFNRSEPKKMYLGEEKYCYALLVGETQLEDEAYYGVVELTFTCFDPYFYGREHEIALTAGSTSAFDVKGNVPAYPVAELTASSTSVTITNVGTGDFVTVPDVTSGSKLVIDMERQLSTKAGAYAPVNLLSDYFEVEGSAKVKVTGANGTLKYTERYL